jgi:hypothetical protein
MGILNEATKQVLLERHSRGCGSMSEGGVDVVGDIFDLDARHACRVSAVAPLWRHRDRISAI